MSRVEKPLLGILLILCSGVMLATHDGISKHLSTLYPLMVIVWVRYLVQLLLMLGIFAPQKGWDLLRTQRPWMQLARGMSLIGVSLLIFASLRYLPLGEATAVMFLAPLVVVVLSAVVLKEHISRSLWFSVVCGLIGVMIIVRPGGELFTPAIVLPLGAALCFGIYQLLTRRLSRTDNAVTSNFISALIGTLVIGLSVPFFWQAPQTLTDAGLMVALGTLATVGHMLLTHAYRFASAATLAPFTYGQIIFATLIGLFAFGHKPDMWGVLGMTVIIASGLFMALAQRRG